MGNGPSQEPLVLSAQHHEALSDDLDIPHIGLLFPKYLEIIDSKVLRSYQEQIRSGLLAPFYEPTESTNNDDEECPICCHSFPQFNFFRCCNKHICTECVIQLWGATNGNHMPCPFCKAAGSQTRIHFRTMGREELLARRHEDQVVLKAVLAARLRHDEEQRLLTRCTDENFASCNAGHGACVGKGQPGSLDSRPLRHNYTNYSSAFDTTPNPQNHLKSGYRAPCASAHIGSNSETGSAASAWLLDVFLQHAAKTLVQDELQPDTVLQPPPLDSPNCSPLPSPRPASSHRNTLHRRHSHSHSHTRPTTSHGRPALAPSSLFQPPRLPLQIRPPPTSTPHTPHDITLPLTATQSGVYDPPQSAYPPILKAAELPFQTPPKPRPHTPSRLPSPNLHHTTPSCRHHTPHTAYTACSPRYTQTTPSSASGTSPTALNRHSHRSAYATKTQAHRPTTPSSPSLLTSSFLSYPGRSPTSLPPMHASHASPWHQNVSDLPQKHLSTQPEEPGCSRNLLAASDMYDKPGESNSNDMPEAHACGLPVAYRHQHCSPFETPFTPNTSFKLCGGLAAVASVAEQDAEANASGAHEMMGACADVTNAVGNTTAGTSPTSEQKAAGSKGGDWSLRETLGSWVRPAAARCERRRRPTDEPRDSMQASGSVQEPLQPEFSATPAVFESQMVHLSRHSSGETVDNEIIGMHVPEEEEDTLGGPVQLVAVNRSGALGLGSMHLPTGAAAVRTVSMPAAEAAVAAAGVSRNSAVAAATLVRVGSAAAAAEAAATLIRADGRLPAGFVRWGGPLEWELESVMRESGVRVRDVRSGFVARHAARHVVDGELMQHVRQGLLSAVMDWYWWYG